MINRDTQKYEHYLMIKRDTKSNVILPNDKETQTYVTWWPNDKQGYKKNSIQEKYTANCNII